jgi:hypothetical protein
MTTMTTMTTGPNTQCSGRGGRFVNATTRILLAILAVAFMSGCASTDNQHGALEGFLNDDPTLRIDTSAAISRLQHALSTRTVHSLVIYHISPGKHFPISVSSMMVERVFDHCLINRLNDRSSLPAEFLQALERAQPSPSDHLADLRWGFVFVAEDRSRILSLYFDEKGERGVLNGACYTFGSDSLCSWAESICPQWIK